MAEPNTFTIWQMKDNPYNRDVEFASMRELKRQAETTRAAVYAAMSGMQDFLYPSREKAAEHAQALSKLENIPCDSPEHILLRDSAGRDCHIHLMPEPDGRLTAVTCDTKALDNLIEPWRYEPVYTSELPADAPQDTNELLEDIYTRFNIDHPDDFRGHSLSISDVVTLTVDGKTTAHYVDSVGFEPIPDFRQEELPADWEMPPEDDRMWKALARESVNDTHTIRRPEPADYLRNAEMLLEDDYGMIDGIINNGPKQEPAKSIAEQLREFSEHPTVNTKDHKAHNEPSL